jgi:WD40 repeat protein
MRGGEWGDGRAQPPCGPVRGVVPGGAQAGDHGRVAAADDQGVPGRELADHVGSHDVVPDAVAVAAVPGALGEAGLAAQLAGHLQRRGVGDTGQPGFDAAGVKDDLGAVQDRPVSRPSRPEVRAAEIVNESGRQQQAGFHLARVLADRRVLLVIDNVWSAADLAPFLLGGPNAVRLVTTRNVRVCPASTVPFRLGPMSAGEVRELLHRTVPALRLEDAARPAEQCRGWPLLASVVGSTLGQDVAAGARPDRAASDASRELGSLGPPAFDVWDADQRKHAIGHAVTASLLSLEEHVQIPGGPGLRERYLSLAIFPASTPVPFTVLSTWWGREHGWTASAARQFCRVLADRSLIDAYLADRDVILLHDVFRAHLRRLVARDWIDLHRSLIGSYRPLASPGWADLATERRYIWNHLPHHLREGQLEDELGELLASPEYIVAKTAHFGHESLAIDRVALARDQEPDTEPWRTAWILTSGARLLHHLTSEHDIAATLLAASIRARASSAAIGRLRDMAGAQGFDVCWATAEHTDGDGHTGAVTTVATHGDALVSGGEDGIVRIWDLTRSQTVRERHGHTGWVYAVAISPDGRTVASAGDDASIRLWHLDTGESTGVLTGVRRIRSLAFTADGQLISGAEDGQVCLWDVGRCDLIRTMNTPGCPVWTVASGVNGTLIAAGGEDEFVRLYDRASGELLVEEAAHRDWVRAVYFAGDTLVTGSADASARVWKVSGRELTLVRTIRTGARVRAVVATPSADLIVVAGEDATLRAFTGDGAAGDQPVPGGVDWIRALAMRPDRSVIAGCEDGSIRIWNSHGLAIVGNGSDTTWSAAFARDHALLGRANGTVEFRDLASGELTGTFQAREGRVWSLAAGPDLAAAASGDGSVRLWSLTGPWTLTLNEDERRTWAVSLNSTGTRLAASSTNGTTRVWDLPSGQKLWERQTHEGRIRSMAFDASDSLLATGGGDGAARLWQLPGGKKAGEFVDQTSWVRAVSLDPCDRRIAVGRGPGDIHVHDLASGQNIAELRGHNGRVLMIGFTADPDVLVSAAADGTVRSWSLTRQKQLAEVRADASLQTAAFDARKATALVASAGGTMAIRIPANSQLPE